MSIISFASHLAQGVAQTPGGGFYLLFYLVCLGVAAMLVLILWLGGRLSS